MCPWEVPSQERHSCAGAPDPTEEELYHTSVIVIAWLFWDNLSNSCCWKRCYPPLCSMRCFPQASLHSRSHLCIFMQMRSGGCSVWNSRRKPYFPARSLFALPHTLVQCQCKAGSSNISYGARGVWDHTFQLPSASRLAEKCHEMQPSLSAGMPQVIWMNMADTLKEAWAASGSSAERK